MLSVVYLNNINKAELEVSCRFTSACVLGGIQTFLALLNLGEVHSISLFGFYLSKIINEN